MPSVSLRSKKKKKKAVQALKPASPLFRFSFIKKPNMKQQQLECWQKMNEQILFFEFDSYWVYTGLLYVTKHTARDQNGSIKQRLKLT